MLTHANPVVTHSLDPLGPLDPLVLLDPASRVVDAFACAEALRKDTVGYGITFGILPSIHMGSFLGAGIDSMFEHGLMLKRACRRKRHSREKWNCMC